MDNDTAMLGRGLHVVAEIMRVYKQLIRSKSNGQKKKKHWEYKYLRAVWWK